MTRDEIVAAIEARMGDGEPFTFGDLHRLQSIKQPTSLDEPDPYRLADAAIQRWRKRGWISFRRVGRDTFWSLTDAGRAALKEDRP